MQTKVYTRVLAWIRIGIQNGEARGDQKHITKKVSSSPKKEDSTCQVIAVADNLKPT